MNQPERVTLTVFLHNCIKITLECDQMLIHFLLEIFRPNEELLVGVERRTGLAG